MEPYFGQAIILLIGLILEIGIPLFFPPEKQKVFVRVLGVVLIGVASVWFGYELAERRILSTPETHHIRVSASEFPLVDTGVNVKEGDTVEIKVHGDDASWYCWEKYTSPEGITARKEDAYFLRTANLCELVGHITPNGIRFRVGAYEKLEATESGTLYLGANDVEKDYADPPSHNYYDNVGVLAVQVDVYR